MKKVLLKTMMVLVVFAVVIGLAVYEECSIVSKEYERESGIAEALTREINLGLDMVKVAVQTEDVELYTTNLTRVREAMAEIEGLSMMRDEYGGYLEQLGIYVEASEGRTEMLEEMRSLKSAVDSATEAIKKEYGNKDEISRDKVKGAKERIKELSIDVEAYKVERVATAGRAVNDVLDKMAGKAGELADCIDNCYKDKIVKIDDELAEVFKEFVDKAPGVNTEIVEEFELDKMDELKKGHIVGYNDNKGE